MKNYEFKTMLAGLSTVQQIAVWGAVFWRWLFRPQVVQCRSWDYSEDCMVVYVLG